MFFSLGFDILYQAWPHKHQIEEHIFVHNRGQEHEVASARGGRPSLIKLLSC